MAKEDATGQAVESSMEQLLDINRKQNEIVSAQARIIEELRGTTVGLNTSLTQLKRKMFRKVSEKCKSVNNGNPKLPFDYGDLEQIEAEIEEARSGAAEQITVPESRTTNKTPRRNQVVMNNLPVVTVVIEPKNINLSRYIKIGEKHTKTLEMKPGYLYVKGTVRPTCALKDEMEAVDNEEKAVVTAPMPLMPIYKNMPEASMLAKVLLQKYEYHVPFYRQMRQLERLDVRLSRNILDGWFRPVRELLRPLYLKLRKRVLAADYLQADKATLPAINHEKHRTAKEYIWIVRAAVPHLLFFHYDNGSRLQKVAARLLKNFEGYLQSDGHPIYSTFEDREDVYLCDCLAYIRRHIELCKGENPEYAMQELKSIQDMYNAEYMVDKQELPYEKRAELRQRLSEPMLDSSELWLKNTYPKVLRRSLIGKAVAYACSLLPGIRPYLYDGRILINDNRYEDALRPLVISRKNMLFCGNHKAAENMVMIYSLLDSCKEHGISPREWLNDVISKLPYYLTPKSDRDLKKLLLDVWRK